MDDEIDRFEVREDGIEVAEVDLNEGECTLMVGEELTPAARQIVENGGAIAAGDDAVDEVGADETSPTGDENML